ncbi:MAG: hypothetical protein N3G20_05370, partial [Verrucomicrobiae bacterium]|nr:hypothetical protein [Verrucomicrobiae bacterium]
AHNRGYDANVLWSRLGVESEEEQNEDARNVQNAESLMAKHGVRTMAETVCRELGVDPLGDRSSSKARFKGCNAAFPREVVESEVRRILRAHFDKLKGVDEQLERALCGLGPRDRSAWQAIPVPDIRLPKRYVGGLLFGQLVPRFDNRIIAECPITGEKVPTRHSREFLDYRWAMLLANVKVVRQGSFDFEPLTREERQELDRRMRQVGRMTEAEFKKAVRELSGAVRDNLDKTFLHPDSKEALVLDPVQAAIAEDPIIAAVFAKLPETYPETRPRANVARQNR